MAIVTVCNMELVTVRCDASTDYTPVKDIMTNLNSTEFACVNRIKTCHLIRFLPSVLLLFVIFPPAA